jgi:hypothetical protein
LIQVVRGTISVNSVRHIGAASLIIPSLDHLVAPILTVVLAPAMMENVFGAGWVAATIFFIVLGVFQLSWIIVLLKSNNPYHLMLGVFGNLISALIYLVSASGVTIFGVPPQPLIAWGVFIKVLELVFIFASVTVLKRRGAA